MFVASPVFTVHVVIYVLSINIMAYRQLNIASKFTQHSHQHDGWMDGKKEAFCGHV